ncbi:MAG: hypothetical protein DMG86_22755 [Acidobacteria bacterium]|nr:MAG: hypothetical protein DMG86_22755 [Acidobacteriota bacterium]PYX15240.1 MAG: hypothetical protein DMG84_12425 [Acidobacteriota bacterium]
MVWAEQNGVETNVFTSEQGWFLKVFTREKLFPHLRAIASLNATLRIVLILWPSSLFSMDFVLSLQGTLVLVFSMLIGEAFSSLPIATPTAMGITRKITI